MLSGTLFYINSFVSESVRRLRAQELMPHDAHISVGKRMRRKIILPRLVLVVATIAVRVFLVSFRINKKSLALHYYLLAT